MKTVFTPEVGQALKGGCSSWTRLNPVVGHRKIGAHSFVIVFHTGNVVGNVELPTLTKVWELGIIIYASFSFNDNISGAINKALGTLGFITGKCLGLS